MAITKRVDADVGEICDEMMSCKFNLPRAISDMGKRKAGVRGLDFARRENPVFMWSTRLISRS